jgi:hypothetical protein
VFATLTENKIEYRKVQHSSALTAWLLVNSRADLVGLFEYVSELVGEVEGIPAQE